jgi:hypothetical protein
MTAVGGIQIVTRASGLAQLALGLLFWTGNALALIPIHMLNGLLFVLLLELQAALAAWAGVSWRLVLFAVVWGVVVPVLGVTQTQLLPGGWHWVVQVAHLAVGLVAMGLAERLGLRAKARLAARRLAAAAPPAPAGSGLP